ncbi:hypothetical protein [Anderseniella sp. Alg231-50]|uniref:hypothetical protein n=1 Tax=Anderseniella sp. Alg231-50 TaxID=1922226 RepID=UPI00307C4C0C
MKYLSIVLAGAVLALSVPTVMTTSALAYQCSNETSQARGRANKKWMSRAKARKAWSVRVKGEKGLAWSVWKIAKQRSLTCKKIASRWTCLAKAKPCKYVVP